MKRNILIAAGFMDCFAVADEAKREMDPGICADVHLYYEEPCALSCSTGRNVSYEPETVPNSLDPAREAEKGPRSAAFPFSCASTDRGRKR